MLLRSMTLLVALGAAACSSSPDGRIVVAITIDWEGAYISPEGLQAIDTLRARIGNPPMTHFISAAYFTKTPADPGAGAAIARAVAQDDELAMHVHAWRSLATASAITPKVSPSFTTGTDELVELEDGDLGVDTDLDVYDVSELRALLRTSRDLLETTREPVSSAFRAAGYLGTPKMLSALCGEGYRVDSSAIDARQLDTPILAERVRELWPDVGALPQPYVIRQPGCELVELPITAIADFVEPAAIVTAFESARALLARDASQHVFIVLVLTQETAAVGGRVVSDALATIRARHELSDRLTFVTVSEAARRARERSL